MTPREFLDTIVRPDVNEFHAAYGDIRKAHHAISTLDALAAHIFVWAKTHVPSVVPMKNDAAYRFELAARSPEFGLLRDIAKAQKHVRLDMYNPQITHASQVTSRTVGWGEGAYGKGRYGGPQQVLVDVGPDRFCYLESIIDEALRILEMEMTKIGC